MCGGGNQDDETQYDPSKLPEGWEQNIKRQDYKAEDYEVNRSFKRKKLVDQRRKVRDCFCCLIFLAFIAALFGFAFYGIMKGEPEKLMASVDGDGNLCGYGKHAGYPDLYIADIKSALKQKNYGMFASGVCVKDCPKASTKKEDFACIDLKGNKGTRDSCTKRDLYDTIEVWNYCVPNPKTFKGDDLKAWLKVRETFKKSFVGAWMQDIWKARKAVLASLGIALTLTIVYTVLMHWCSGICAWASVILIQVGLIAMGCVTCYLYVTKADLTGEITPGVTVSAKAMLGAEDTDTTLFWATVVAWIAAILFCCFLICNCHSLAVSIGVIKTAATWLADTKRLLFMPLVFSIIGIVITFIWVAGLICVCSMTSEPIMSNKLTTSTSYTGERIHGDQGKHLVWDDNTYYMVYTMCFGFVWLVFFIISFNDFVTIVAAIQWYFSDKTTTDLDGIPGDSNVTVGFIWGAIYHPGSLAFGSFIMAVSWIIHKILTYLAKKMEATTGNNCCAKCIIGCIMCCVDCFDRMIRYLTKNAYIYMALSNESFCMSSIHAYLLMLRNMAKFSMVSSIGSVFMFIGKVCITVCTTWLGYMLIDILTPENDSVSSHFTPTLVIALLAYLIAAIFIGVFDAGANTILQCYLMDKEMGGTDDEAHVPEALKGFLPEGDGKTDEVELSKANEMA